MNTLVFHLVTGQAFFTGSAMVLLALFASVQNQMWVRRAAPLLMILGIILVVLSTTPLPLWCVAVVVAAMFFWLIAKNSGRWRALSTSIAAAAWMIAVAVETPYHAMPTIQPIFQRHLAIIGDSVTAGIGGDEKAQTWPKLLAAKHELAVADYSNVGETAGSAVKRITERPIVAPLVMIEIGGNDILGSTSTSQFRKDLEALLAGLQEPGRQVVMFELPLPPFHHEYGEIQRTLSRKYSVGLIPKRVFANVIAGADTTLDSIHLSQSGHRQMATGVWQLIGSAYAAAKPSD